MEKNQRSHKPIEPTLRVWYTLVFNTGMIHCIAASADGQIMCSTAEDKSLKVFNVVNFGELRKYILYSIITHKEVIYSLL